MPAARPPLLMVAAVLLGLLPPLTAQGWEFKMISSGANRPALALWRSPWREGLVALRTGSDRIEDSVRAALVEEGAASAEGPTCLVVGEADGAAIAREAGSAARRFLPILRAHLGGVRDRASAALGGNWDDAALLVLSNVLLDNWQIRGVEREWLAAERPQRAGGRYYCALLERPAGAELEPFGIWGNQVRNGIRWQVGVYGNDRHRPGLHNGRAADLLAGLGIDTSTVADSLRLDLVVDRLVAARRGGVPPAVRELAEHLGLWREGRLALVEVGGEVADSFEALAAGVRDDLVAFLRAEEAALASLQRELRYDAVPRAEFRIWWYHFFYTAVTRAVIEEGWIPAGSSRRVTYVIPRG